MFRVRNTTAQQCTVVLQISQTALPTWQLFGANVLQATAANLNATIVGTAAEDAAASGNPVMIAGVARTAIVPATVVAGDVVRHTLNISGSLITEPHCVDELRWSYAAAAAGIANSTTPVTIKAAPAAGTHLCLCSGFIMSEALTAATEFVIREITTTTVVFRTKLWTSGMAGTQITFDPPIKITSANGLEIVTLTASVAGAVYFNANGYTANG